MALHETRRGLRLNIPGAPEQVVFPGASVRTVAVLAADYHAAAPAVRVREGDRVGPGRVLFDDARSGVRHMTPGTGSVVRVNCGPRGELHSVVIALDAEDGVGQGGASFSSFSGHDVAGLSRDQIKALLVESGLWTAFRTRPFSQVPNPVTTPKAIFVTAMDTAPLAASPEVVLQGKAAAFETGLMAMVKLTDGHVYLCKAAGSSITTSPYNGILVEEFEGPHPAGAAGFHIHVLEPARRWHTVWHIGYQDVAAIGSLLMTGRLDAERVIALAGPLMKQPRLVRTRLGASISEILAGETDTTPACILSGPPLSGRRVVNDADAFLGRYHTQISLLAQPIEYAAFGGLGGLKRSVFAMCSAGFGMFRNPRLHPFTFNRVARRVMRTFGLYERVMPMNLLATFLMRALVDRDVACVEQYGGLELDEEDVSLCTYVCPEHRDYGALLRQVLERIEREAAGP